MNALHPLGQLIQSVEDSRGWTLREIARRIDERTGRTISHAYVARLKKKPISSITYETIHALAVGLDVPERLVGAAALETMGVRDLDQPEAGAAVAIARDSDLSTRDRRILLAAVREMQDATDHQQPTPDDTDTRVADPPQPDGSTSEVPFGKMPIDPTLPQTGKHSWTPDMPTNELLPLVFDLVEEREHADLRVLREQAAGQLDELLRHLAERRASAGPADTGIGLNVQDRPRSDSGASRPWEQPDFDVAAKRGRNRGREAREQQNRDAEGDDL
ncbi:hypothetical protein DEO23_14165 [Brachybacterium endophyticum]|uniref:Uncharacterized protein n=1 Tax=Brachybacterium endophyticum TaxID=2182385 RepID=A0A2U2RHB8_9MICO|nr:hypothetical protein [Brachybacterium endophyticum]PWH05221.1 hypothetical protein DEO23_14165 [Brachybacterium endophyticum]